MDDVVVLQGVSKSFGKKKIYKEVSLRIREGECVGFIGSNGSGKSVLFQLIAGLIPVDSGSVTINGKQLGDGRDFPADTGILINAPGYIEYYSGYKNLQLLAQIQKKIGDQKIRQTMELVGLDADDRTPVRKYSMGMKQKLGIAQAIMEDQRLIILDEPYNALDYHTNREITKVLMRLKREGKTLLLTSHQHEYLETLCDTMYCIENGGLCVFDEKKKAEYFSI